MRVLKSTFTEKKEQFNAMNNSKVLKDHIGNEFTVVNYVLYDDIADDESVKTILSFQTLEKEYFGTVSRNIMEGFEVIEETFGEISPSNPVNIVINTEKSKNGRDFLTLEVR